MVDRTDDEQLSPTARLLLPLKSLVPARVWDREDWAECILLGVNTPAVLMESLGRNASSVQAVRLRVPVPLGQFLRASKSWNDAKLAFAFSVTVGRNPETARQLFERLARPHATEKDFVSLCRFCADDQLNQLQPLCEGMENVQTAISSEMRRRRRRVGQGATHRSSYPSDEWGRSPAGRMFTFWLRGRVLRNRCRRMGKRRENGFKSWWSSNAVEAELNRGIPRGLRRGRLIKDRAGSQEHDCVG